MSSTAGLEYVNGHQCPGSTRKYDKDEGQGQGQGQGQGYLDPQKLKLSYTRSNGFGRQLSTNDSGIVDLSGSRVGLSIHNDVYAVFDDDEEDEVDGFRPPDGHFDSERPSVVVVNHPFSHSPPPYTHGGKPHPLSPRPPAFKFTKDGKQLDAAAADKLRCHDYYEELPESKSTDDPNLYTKIDDPPPLSFVSNNNNNKRTVYQCSDGMQQGNMDRGKERRRSNPIYEKPGIKENEENYVVGTCVFRTIGVLGFLLSMAALAVAILSIIWLTDGRYAGTKYDDLATKYDDLVANYSALYQQILTLKAENVGGGGVGVGVGRSSSETETDLPILQQLMSNNSQLQQSINDLQLKVNDLEYKVNAEDFVVQNLSNQMTIQQPKQLVLRGLTNLSLCSHTVKTYGLSAYIPESSTDVINLNSLVVLGVTCSTVGGTQSFLVYNDTFPMSYSCICRGQWNGATSRYCNIHYWTCPIM